MDSVVSIEIARIARAAGSRPRPRATTRSVRDLVAALPRRSEDIVQIRAMTGLPRDPELAEIRQRLAGEQGEAAAEELGRTGTKVAIAVLEAALADEDLRVRLAAAAGLAAAGAAASPAVEALTAALDDPSWAVIIAAANVLQDLGPIAVRAGRRIEQLLWGEPWRVAVENDLGSVARAAIGPALDSLLEEQSAAVRSALGRALDAVG